MNKPIVWTIAGSDNSGGAGVQVDIKTLTDLDVHAHSVITAITAQNKEKVHHIEASSRDSMQAQINSLPTPDVVKLGMLTNIDVIRQFLEAYDGLVVCDPVLTSSSGTALTDLTELTSLFPYIDLLTPNISEAKTISKLNITDDKSVKRVAKKLISMGVKQVLIKGGHAECDEARDYWYNGERGEWLSSPWLDADCRGTGCALSSAIAAQLALQHDMLDAIVIAKMYINQALDERDKHILGHHGFPKKQHYLPRIMRDPDYIAFANLHYPIGIYPIVDSAEWIERLAPLGIKTLQLRIKERKRREWQIARSIDIARKHDIQLFINDHWRLAIKYHAYGVHLGQEDLRKADLHAIAKANCCLGVSTHSFAEVAIAHGLNPSYIAVGPIFQTTTKIMPFKPKGIEQLQYWQQLLSDYPVVAIGGINETNINAIQQTGVDGIAMISAITQHEAPEQALQELMAMVNHD